jgi:hypothetical protein
MEMRNYLIFIMTFLLIAISCQKAEDRACLKFVGDKSTKTISLGKTDSLYLYDNVEYVLVPDTVNFVELEGGENLLNHIECSSYNDKLEIRNNNTCNFLRSYKKKVKAFIHIKEIRFIHFEGTEYLKNQDTLKSGELRLVIRDGAGPVELTIQNGYMSAGITHGWGDFTLHGKTNFAFLNCNTNSFCNTSNLKVGGGLLVLSNTGGNMMVNAEGSDFHPTIKRDGNILYTGIPNSITVENSGNGEVEKIE